MEDEIMKRFLSGAALAAVLVVIPVVGFAADARYIVKFNAGRSDAGHAALRGMGAQIVLSLDPQGAVAALIPEQALPGLAHNPNIEYIEIDEIRTPMATWSDRPVGGEILPFGIQMVQADLVVSNNEAAKRICIIDSGYSQQHEDLRNADASITQNATDKGSGTWDKDSCGHGSHVAGTIMATAGNGKGVIGVIPGVSLHIVKVFGDDDLDGGNCSWTYSSTLVDALNKCEAADSNITSMSLGGGFKSRTEDVAFSNAYKRGMLHVAAAGNAGNKTTSYPAGYSSVISVAAVDANETVASFSQQNRDVEIAAPGVGVLSTVPWLDVNTLTFSGGSGSISGGHIEFSARTTGVAGTLVDGGLCSSTDSWPGSVVLCQRGSIDFYTKVQNVKNGGGVAAVIYNNITSDPTCGDFAGTLGDGNSSTIPAIGVSCDDGASALSHSGQNATVFSELTVPDSGYEAWGGTSMATPHVSGVAALIWSCYPGLSNQQIRDAMNATAKGAGAAGRDNAYGYGIVQAKAAVDSLGGSNSCTTSTSSKY
ncbi:MAG TPA: S8 family serine peptidase [Casimicrobiaceae bacterium]|nr:S8 family serine peptidase [Casimicrobiaceae bacterium]